MNMRALLSLTRTVSEIRSNWPGHWDTRRTPSWTDACYLCGPLDHRPQSLGWRWLASVGLLGTLACNTPPARTPPPARTATADAHGFGDAIPWEPYAAAFEHAKRDGMPVMLVVHASWCGRCKELQPSFFDDEIEALSQQFVMINVDQDVEPSSTQHAPDGTYIPRVVFFDSNGQLDASLSNPRRRTHRYFYTPADDLSAVMRKAISLHERSRS